MKKLSKLFLISFPIISSIAVSCNKIDISLAPQTFSSTSQTNAQLLNNQLAGVYSTLEAADLYGWGLWGYFQPGNDETYSSSDYSSTSAQYLIESLQSSSQTANYNSFWKSLYGGIESANVLLSVVNQPAMDSATRANIKGQALFLRAYYFYLLVSNYGDVPYKTQLTSNTTNFNIPATASKSIYDSIIKDMTTADSLVQSMTVAQTTTVVTKSAVEGILTRVCLSAAGYPVNGGLPYYQKALTWAQKIINSGVHSLYSTPHPQFPSTPAYARVFINNMMDNRTDNNTVEDMWDAAFLSNGVGSYASLGYTYTQQLGVIEGILCPSATSNHCAATYKPFPTLYSLYGQGDLRRDWAISNYFLDSSGYNHTNGFTIKINPGIHRIPKDTITNSNGTKTIQYDTLGIYGSGAVAVIDSITPTGGIFHITIVDSGTGYSKTYLPSVSITSPAGSVGTGFTSTFTVNSDSTISIAVKTPGSNYFSIYSKSIAKWRRDYFELNAPQNNSYTSCNFPIVRYADVLLMAAEADLIVNGGTVTGLKYFNQVRRRAYGYSPNTASPYDAPSITIDSIKAERSRELCFEGVRRNDLKRWGLSNWQNTLNNLVTQLGNYNTTFPPSSSILSASTITITNFLSNPQKYSLFPIPAGELAIEQALYQNPGW
jgi:hypothetical protein